MLRRTALFMAALLLMGVMGYGRPAEASLLQTEETVLSATQTQKQAEEVRKVGAYFVVVNKGSNAAVYPYLVRTNSSVWYLAKADMDLLGEDAFFQGLSDILRYFDADTADARRALAGHIPEKIPPVEIRTDFSNREKSTEFLEAQYDSINNRITIFNGWHTVKASLLHEYVHYLTMHCAAKKTQYCFFIESVAEYVAYVLCENRMYRLSGIYHPVPGIAIWSEFTWSVAWDSTNYIKAQLGRSKGYAEGLHDGVPYFSVGQYTAVRRADKRLPDHIDDLSYQEGVSLAIYLMETYGEAKFMDNWDLPTSRLAGIYGKTERQLLKDWSVWNSSTCAKYGWKAE